MASSSPAPWPSVLGTVLGTVAQQDVSSRRPKMKRRRRRRSRRKDKLTGMIHSIRRDEEDDMSSGSVKENYALSDGEEPRPPPPAAHPGEISAAESLGNPGSSVVASPFNPSVSLPPAPPLPSPSRVDVAAGQALAVIVVPKIRVAGKASGRRRRWRLRRTCRRRRYALWSSLPFSPPPKSALSHLNELSPGLSFQLASHTGPPHAPRFTLAVEVNGTTFTGAGGSKREAKRRAAERALRSFVQFPDACEAHRAMGPAASLPACLDFACDPCDPSCRDPARGLADDCLPEFAVRFADCHRDENSQGAARAEARSCPPGELRAMKSPCRSSSSSSACGCGYCCRFTSPSAASGANCLLRDSDATVPSGHDACSLPASVCRATPCRRSLSRVLQPGRPSGETHPVPHPPSRTSKTEPYRRTAISHHGSGIAQTEGRRPGTAVDGQGCVKSPQQSVKACAFR